MAAGKALPLIKYLIGLFGCAAAYPWLESASGNPESVIPQFVVVTLLLLTFIELLFQLISKVYTRSIPALVMFVLFLIGFLNQVDSMVVVGAIVSIGLCFLSSFSLLLDRFRKGGPFFVFLFFLVPIFVGAALLMFPRCQAVGDTLTASESIFTAISAVTVTGLTVIDVGTQLSSEGQLVLLGLIQLGGIGTVTLFAFFALILGHGLGIRQGRSLRESLDGLSSTEVKNLLGTICVLTLLIELLGTGLLSMVSGNEGTLLENLFHSVSAFCNAGFTLTSDSLASWNPIQKIIMAGLILLGGIGFPVLHEFKGKLFHNRNQRISVQARLILVVSMVLLFGGAFFLFVTGAGNESWFWSITSRTAGFSTSSTSALPLATTVILMLLMAIGASPGSTGGGLKTTTVGVLFLAAWAEFRSEKRVVMWKRTVQETVIRTSAVLALIASITWLILTTLLLLSESEALQDGRVQFIDLAFEVTSALGTVGLSRDVTILLSDSGRWVIEAAMIMGRLGPLALVISIASLSPVASKGDRPHGRVMLG